MVHLSLYGHLNPELKIKKEQGMVELKVNVFIFMKQY